MIPVLNKKTDKAPAGAVYVGRPTIYGNLFKIGRDGTREEVLGLFQDCFLQRVQADEKYKAAIHKLLSATALVCWCAPLPCHGDIIAKYLDSIRTTGGVSC